ncbi:MAG: DUF1572 family protein [Cyclobacteriaceae bacterium]
MNETIRSIHDLLIRDLDRLKREIEGYEDEKNLWKVSGEINNSAGNLALHLCGNLQHFIGATLGQSGYIRHRDDEFNLKNVPRVQIIAEIETTKQAIADTLAKFDESSMARQYPIKVFDQPSSNISFLIHLSGHLNYHLGQINYHRRLLEF